MQFHPFKSSNSNHRYFDYFQLYRISVICCVFDAVFPISFPFSFFIFLLRLTFYSLHPPNSYPYTIIELCVIYNPALHFSSDSEAERKRKKKKRRKATPSSSSESDNDAAVRARNQQKKVSLSR